MVGGNAAWFPGYSLVVRALKPKGLTPAKTAKIVSTAFALVLLLAVCHILPAHSRSRWPAALLAGLFPGFIYDHTVFPISMTACLGVVALLLASKRKYLAAGAAGALAASAYPTGFLVSVTMLLAIAGDAGLGIVQKVRAILQGPALGLLGLVGVFVYQERSIGWNGFLRMRQQYFDNTVANPLATFATNTAPVWQGEFRLETVPPFQSVVMIFVMLLTLGIAWRHRRSLDVAERLLAMNATLFWLFPYLVGTFGPTRSEALLIGIVPVLARLPRAGQIGLLAVFAALGAAICVLFFRNILV